MRGLAAIVLVVASVGASGAFAHGGGLDALGCHNDRKAGVYHCHKGALAGQSFGSKADAQKALARDGNTDISGAARIVDGDTLHLNGSKIRLHGIDAPETRQECQDKDGASYLCGEASTEVLKALVGSLPVRCEGSTRDRYGRLIGVCYANGVNLNAEMVRQGWALAYRRYSKDYVSAEGEAQAAKRGRWAGDFDKPWDWRRGQ